MGFTIENNMVRVDLFKESGKYKDTISLKFDRYFTEIDNKIELIDDTFKRCMQEQYPNIRNCICVCLDPYHEHSYPLMLRI